MADTFNVSHHLLVLWDIDKTLVDGGGLGPAICDGAFERLSGITRSHPFTPDGSTDPAIVADLFELHGLSAAALTPPLIERAYLESFESIENQWRQLARPMPGARQATVALGQVDGVVQSVLTGNVAANARAKLESVGLGSGIDFAVGAYGSDLHTVRADLVVVAQNRAEAKYQAPFGRHNTVLIGDTPLDVQAGIVGGAQVIAVANGDFGIDDLAAAGADAVLTDLTTVASTVLTLVDGPRLVGGDNASRSGVIRADGTDE